MIHYQHHLNKSRKLELLADFFMWWNSHFSFLAPECYLTNRNNFNIYTPHNQPSLTFALYRKFGCCAFRDLAVEQATVQPKTYCCNTSSRLNKYFSEPSHHTLASAERAYEYFKMYVSVERTRMKLRLGQYETTR